MSSACATKLGSALLLAVVLSGCSDLYTDRRLRINASAGDAIAVNQLTQMTDPWPRGSGNRNIAFNGEKMQTAVERYRTNKVTNPVSAMTSSTSYQALQPVVVAPSSGKP
jgi:hypothetical protein